MRKGKRIRDRERAEKWVMKKGEVKNQEKGMNGCKESEE